MKLTLLFTMLAASFFVANTQPVLATELLGEYQDGNYGGDEAKIRYFVFKYHGTFNDETVRDKSWAVVQELKKQRRTAARPLARYGISTTSPAPAGKAWLARGEAVVLGYYDETTNTWGWIASNGPKFLSNGRNANGLSEVLFHVGETKELFSFHRGSFGSRKYVAYTTYVD